MSRPPMLLRVLLLSIFWIAVIPVALAQAEEAPAAPVAEPDATQVRGEAYSNFMRAFFAARRGAFREAGDELEAALERQPESVEVHIQAARMYTWIGQRAEAERLARRAVELAPEDADALGFLAEMLTRGNRGGERPESQTEALELLERLAERGDISERQLRQLAQLRWNTEDRDGALEAAQELLQRRPGDSAAAQAVFRMLLGRGQQQEALELYLRYLERHPNDTPFVQETRELATQIDGWGTIVEALHGNTALDGRATIAHGLIAEALLREGRTGDSIEPFELALLQDGSDPDLRVKVGMAYRLVGRLADAAAMMRGLAAELPANATVQRLLGQTLERQGDVEGALNAYTAALRILIDENRDPESAVRDEMRRRMAGLSLDRDRHDAARRFLDDLEDPSTPDSLRTRVALALEDEDVSDARSLARKLRSAGDEATAARVEGDSYALEGKWRKAEDRYRDAVAAGGDFMRVGIAHRLLEAGKEEQGLQWLDGWVDAAADDPDAHFQRGAYLYEMDRFDEAEVSMRRAIELAPEHAQALNYLGYGLAERNERLDEALDLVERALAVDGWNGAYLDSLGWIHFQRGDFEAAREPLERAAREYPHDTTILEHLGDVYVQLGEPDLALTAWRRALENVPDEPDVIQAKIDKLDRPLDGDPSSETARKDFEDDSTPPRQ